MSIELISVLIAVVAIGATLGGLILISNRGLRQDMREDMGKLRQDMREDMGKLRQDIKDLRGEVGELRERMTHEVGELRERMARLEGLLEGLREAITGRVSSS